MVHTATADTARADETALSEVLSGYRQASQDPKVVTETFRQIWRVRGERAAVAIDVPACPYTAEELVALTGSGRRLGYLPAVLATQAGRALLAPIFPAMDDFVLLEDNSVTNDVDYAGWFDYDASVDSPLANMNEADELAELDRLGQVPMTMNQYIVAAQDNRLIDGHYLDEGVTWSRTASKSDGRLIAGRFDGTRAVSWNIGEVHKEGCLCAAYDVGPHDKGVALGIRSTTRWSEVAPAGKVTKHKPISSPPVITDLDAEWERIVSNYLRLGFHVLLSQSEAEYRASFPKFSTQPARYVGRFRVPLLVETRIRWEQQADMAGIRKSSFIHLQYEPVDDRHRSPASPYAAWFTAWGERFPNGTSAIDALTQLADDERGASLIELLAMEIAYPELNESGRYWDAIGNFLPPQQFSGMDKESTIKRYAGIWRPRGIPEIATSLNPFPYTFFRPLVRGAEIVTAD